MVGLLYLRPWLARVEATGRQRDADQVLLLFVSALVLLVCGTVGLGVCLIRLGRQACREERFPPARSRLVKRASVCAGADAVRRGRWTQAMGAVLLLLSLGLAIAGARVVAYFGGYAG